MTVAVAPAPAGRGSGRRLLDELERRAVGRGAARRHARGARRQRRRAAVSTNAAGYVVLGIRRRYYQPGDVDALVHAEDVGGEGSRRWLTSRWCSASRPRATRPASASCAARPCSPTRSRAASTSTRGSAGWCPRWPAAPTSRRWCRRSSAPARRPGSRLRDLDAVAVTVRPGAGRGAAGGRGVGQGARPRARHAALRRQPPRRARRRRHRRARPLPEPTMALLVSGGHSSLLLVPDVTDDVRSARRDDRRRGRRGVRQGRPGARACRSPAGRTSTGWRATVTGRHRLPARADQGRDWSGTGSTSRSRG